MPNPASSGTGFLDVSSWLQIFGEAEGWKYMDALHENVGRLHPLRLQALRDGRRPGEYVGRGSRSSSAPRGSRSRARRSTSSSPRRSRAGTWRRPRSSRAPRTLEAAKTLVDWSVSEKAMRLYSEGYAVVAIPGIAQPIEFLPGNMLEKMIKNDFAVGGHQPRADPRRVAEALRRQVGAEEARRPGLPGRRGARPTGSPASHDPGRRSRPAGAGVRRPLGPGAPRPYLRIERLTKRFGGFTALRDISLEVFEGEFVCFLGPSGCGKTTLLRAIAGLDIQTSGRIEQAGRDISALPPDRRDFGIVFQSYALFPNLTVGPERRLRPREPARSGAPRSTAPGAGAARPGRASPTRATSTRPSSPAASSSGWRWPGRWPPRPAFSSSTSRCRRSTPRSAFTCASEIRQLQRRLGVTTIMVTHDQEEALTMADRIVVMNHGVIEQVGTPLEIYREPALGLRRRLHRHHELPPGGRWPARGGSRLRR